LKVVILAGGKGSRFSEETHLKPKPMIEIGDKPILWHIMKIYSAFGFNEFVVCLGYKGYLIKEYFSNYFLHQSDITFDLKKNEATYHNSQSEPWKVTLVDTGLNTMTGGRIKRVQDHIGNEPFMLTYGDGVGDVDIAKLVAHHKASGKHATLTAVQPSGRFGSLGIEDDNTIHSFKEKPSGDGHWVNGGFFVLQPEVFDLIESDESIWERKPLEALAQNGQLSAFKHPGFWHPMDKLNDKIILSDLLENGDAPWTKNWT